LDEILTKIKNLNGILDEMRDLYIRRTKNDTSDDRNLRRI